MSTLIEACLYFEFYTLGFHEINRGSQVEKVDELISKMHLDIDFPKWSADRIVDYLDHDIRLTRLNTPGWTNYPDPDAIPERFRRRYFFQKHPLLERYAYLRYSKTNKMMLVCAYLQRHDCCG